MNFKNFYEQQDLNIVAFFLSDLHLRNHALQDIKLLENFIEHLTNLATKNSKKYDLYFLGDIFDFWFGPASPVKQQVAPLISKLKIYNQTSGKVTFFEGNHDVHMSDFFNKLGFEVVQNYKVIQIEQKKIILEHGDLFNPNDKNYLFLRRFLRQPWMRILATYIVPAFITSGIGYYFSNLSSKSTKVRSEDKSNKIKSTFLNYAKQRLEVLDGDVLIAGHTHERMNEFYQFKDETEKRQIINLGSWFDVKTILALKQSDTKDLIFEFFYIK